MNAPVFSSDIPCEVWLSEKREDSMHGGRNRHGVLKSFGPVTGRFDRNLKLQVSALALLPGECNEQSNVRPESLRYIRDNATEVFKTPVYVEVDPLGVPWISEGNHRIMVAAELGMPSLPVEVRYFSGGERLAIAFAPDKLLELDSIEVNRVAAPTPRALSDTHLPLAYDIKRKTNMDEKWKAEYFDKFIESMVANGWTDDRGNSAGQYGIVLHANGEIAVLAWCYPPANDNDINGLSKIIIRGVVPGGTKQDCFYFNDRGSFVKALNVSALYSTLRLSVAVDTIEKAKASRMAYQEDLAVSSMLPFEVSADTRQEQLETLGFTNEKDYENHRRVISESRELEKKQLAGYFELPAKPVKDGHFSGLVVDVAGGVVTQKIDREGHAVQHDGSKLSMAVQVGNVVDIIYRAGQGVVSGIGKAVGVARYRRRLNTTKFKLGQEYENSSDS